MPESERAWRMTVVAEALAQSAAIIIVPLVELRAHNYVAGVSNLCRVCTAGVKMRRYRLVIFPSYQERDHLYANSLLDIIFL
jgi:hypothetical protein